MEGSMSRRSLLVRGGAVLGAAALAPFVPRGWPGSGFLVPDAYGAVRLDTNNPTANFTPEGGQGYTPSPAVLSLNDQSVSDIISFYASDPDAAPGSELDIVATFQATGTSCNADGGVHLVINEGGIAKAVIAVTAIKAGQRGIGLAAGDQFCDAGNYPVFVQADWTSPIRVRVRRTAAGDGEIVEINGVAPVPRAFLARASLPPRNRTTPTVEFGCASVEAITTAGFTEFFSERVAGVPGTLAITSLRIRDADSTDRLRFRADFTIGAGNNGIDPASENVTVRLSTPAGAQFYPPPASDFNPITGFDARGTAPRRRWSINASEQTRTGIERFDIDEDPNNSGGVSLRDATTNVPAIDYSTVNAEIVIGDDMLTGTVHLEQSPPGSGRWREL
jgi:hypothetical protein